jgi:hypothetical protein
MRCPHCNSTDLKKASLIYATGVYESRGRIGGLLFGNGDVFFVGKYRGANQSLLSKMVAPPRKAPYVAPLALWLMGFFIVMAFAGRGRLSWMMGALSVGYLLMLPTYLLAALFYNFFLRPTKKTEWEGKFRCQRCGFVCNPDESHRLTTRSPA